MANTYKTLGQQNPGATLTTIYTVPAGTYTVAKLTIANRGGSDKTFRVAVRPLGATIQDRMYLFYDTVIPANDTMIVDGIALTPTDIVQVYGSDTGVSFNLNGVEIT